MCSIEKSNWRPHVRKSNPIPMQTPCEREGCRLIGIARVAASTSAARNKPMQTGG